MASKPRSRRYSLARLDVDSPPLDTDLLEGDANLLERNGIDGTIKYTQEAGLAILQVRNVGLTVRFGLGYYIGWA